MAKTAFQKDQNPLDASLYYLALKKKNVLTHLFKVKYFAPTKLLSAQNINRFPNFIPKFGLKFSNFTQIWLFSLNFMQFLSCTN